MKNELWFRVLAILSMFAFLSCGQPISSPGENAPGSTQGNRLAKKGPIVEKITGSGSFTAPQGDQRTFSFTARRYSDGSVDGQWQRVRRIGGNAATGFTSHGQISCFTITGNQVWIGGFETKGSFPGEAAFRIVDNGQGGNAAPDSMSLEFVGQLAGFAANYCATTPSFPSFFALESGNLKIH